MPTSYKLISDKEKLPTEKVKLERELLGTTYGLAPPHISSVVQPNHSLILETKSNIRSNVTNFNLMSCNHYPYISIRLNCKLCP